MKETIIITGGCGFIGTNIALLANKKKYKVVVFDSLIRKHTEENAVLLEKLGVEIIRGDIRSPYDLDRLPKKSLGIIHLAANPGISWSIQWPMYDFSTNAVGTLNVLEFARKNSKTPVIFASTNKIYSEEVNVVPVKEKKTRYIWDLDKLHKSTKKSIREGLTEKGVNENFPMDSSGTFPHSPYGVSKATGDLYMQEYYHIYNLPTVINRMSCIYGLYQKGVEDQGWMDWFVRAKLHNTPLNIYGNGKQVRDVLFGSDVAELYLKELENIDKTKGQVFNVGGGVDNAVSLLEVIDYLNKKDGKEFPLHFKERRSADHKIYISDTTKVQKELHWTPKTSVWEGLDQMWDQYNT